MVCRVTLAARAMSSTLAAGLAFRTSGAAARIAAMLCRASARCRLRLTAVAGGLAVLAASADLSAAPP